MWKGGLCRVSSLGRGALCTGRGESLQTLPKGSTQRVQKVEDGSLRFEGPH